MHIRQEILGMDTNQKLEGINPDSFSEDVALELDTEKLRDKLLE